MHPFDAASFLSANPAEGSFEPPPPQEEELVGAASSPSPSRGTRAGGGNANAGIIRCQDCRHRAKAYCAHCCSDRGGFVCPGHAKTPHVPASQCSERERTLAASASASAAAVDVEPIPKRPRWTALLPSVAAPSTTSSVDQPIAAAVPERFAQEVSLDAVFRRVRLGGPEELEVAYHTTVTIAGHVFRGVLYDVGLGPHSGSTSTAASDTDGSGEVGSSLSTAGGSCLDLTLGL